MSKPRRFLTPSQSKNPHALTQSQQAMKAQQSLKEQRHVMQLKTATALPKPRTPVAPPVYRPQPLPKVLQKKNAVNQEQSGKPNQTRSPQAPQAYRPQPTPKVLQTKMNGVQPKPVNQSGASTTPVRRPQTPPAVAQRTTAQPRNAFKPNAAGNQSLKMNANRQGTQSGVPRNAIQRQTTQPTHVITARHSQTIQRQWVKRNGVTVWETPGDFDKNKENYQATEEKKWMYPLLPESVCGVRLNKELCVYEPVQTKLTMKNATAQEMEDALALIPQSPDLEEITFMRCTFPNWSMEVFSQLKWLTSLTIYSPRGNDPTDNLAGLVKVTSLRELTLVMCHFMDEACYQNLAKMRQLRKLSLLRTLTTEFSPGVRGPDKHHEDGRVTTQIISVSTVVLNVLKNLIKGVLQELDLRGCAVLAEHVKDLKALGETYNCKVTYSDFKTKAY